MAQASMFPLPNRWLVVGTTFLILAGTSGTLLLAYPGIEGIRQTIRATARISLILFALAFTATALYALLPNVFTRWQAANRRYLGLSFALSHFVHLGAIAALALADPQLFFSLTNAVTRTSGGVAYLLIAAMAVTSFSLPRRRIGEEAWRRLHLVGGWYIWLSFLVAVGKRAVIDSFYLPFLAIVVAVFAIRVLGWRMKKGRTTQHARSKTALDLID